jgi:hypothetical protein
VIHISHDKMHCPSGMTWKQRDERVRSCIRFHRVVAPDAVIGLNTMVTDFKYIPLDTLRQVDSVTLLWPKPHGAMWWGDDVSVAISRVEKYKLKVQLSSDGCLYHLIRMRGVGGCALGSLCSQGRTSMALDVHGKASACSNIKKICPAKGIKDGWEQVRRKGDADPMGCIMPRTTGR